MAILDILSAPKLIITRYKIPLIFPIIDSVGEFSGAIEESCTVNTTYNYSYVYNISSTQQIDMNISFLIDNESLFASLIYPILKQIVDSNPVRIENEQPSYGISYCSAGKFINSAKLTSLNRESTNTNLDRVTMTLTTTATFEPLVIDGQPQAIENITYTNNYLKNTQISAAYPGQVFQSGANSAQAVVVKGLS